MTRDEVLAKLREHESALRAHGVVRLSLFGSTARGDGRPDSDIDLMAKYDDTKRISLLDIVGIQLDLESVLGRPVDLVEEGRLKPRVQRSVERDVVNAF